MNRLAASLRSGRVSWAVAAVVILIGSGSVAYACTSPGGCGSWGGGGSCPSDFSIIWSSYSSPLPVPASSGVACSATLKSSSLLVVTASNLIPGAGCDFFATITNTGSYAGTLGDTIDPSSTCASYFLYSDNINAHSPVQTISAGGTFGYQSSLSLSPSTPSSCEGSSASFLITITGAATPPPLKPPTISASPSTIYSGQSSVLLTTSSFSGGISPYTCQWLVQSPSASSYSNLGGPFGCSAGDTPSTSTGTLTTTGTWHFELQVTDSEPVTVVSNAVSVTVEPKVTTYSVTFSETGLPSGLTWQVTVDGVTKSLITVGGCANSLTWTGLSSGTYSYTVAGNPGWHQSTLPYTGTVVVSGASVTEPVLVYTQVTYAVTFTETGLPSGDSWSVTLGGVTGTSKGSTITFLEANGTYSYSVNTSPSCPRTPSSGTVTVNGAPVSVSVKVT